MSIDKNLKVSMNFSEIHGTDFPQDMCLRKILILAVLVVYQSVWEDVIQFPCPFYAKETP